MEIRRYDKCVVFGIYTPLPREMRECQWHSSTALS
jgi:hypothetical protein